MLSLLDLCSRHAPRTARPLHLRPTRRAVHWGLGLGLLALTASPAPAAENASVRLGYLGPYLVQPGARLSADVSVWSTSDPATQPHWQNTLIVGLELAGFNRPRVHTSVIVGGLVGYRMQSPGGCCVHTLAASLGYLGEHQIASIRVDLATGEKTQTRELKSNALVAAHYLFAWQFLDRWGWYIDLGVGQSFWGAVPSALYFAPETGVQFRFDLGGQP